MSLPIAPAAAHQPQSDFILLGHEADTNEPIGLPRGQLKRGHIHVRGKTGSGKTSKILKPLALQLMRSYPLTYRRADGTIATEVRRDAVFVLDFGGDRPFFHALKRAAEAEAPTRTMKWFSLDPRRSYAFDPLQFIAGNGDRVVKVCSILLSALGLEFPGVYGGAYFTQRAQAALLRNVDAAIQERLAGRSTGLDGIARRLDLEREKDEDAVRMAFAFLARYEQLQPVAGDSSVIDFKESIRDGHVVYCDCPTIGEGETARQIGGLAMHNIVEGAIQLRRETPPEDRDRPAPHAFVFIDEFQTIATRLFSEMLVLARKFNVTFVLANQSTNQLEQMGQDLTDIVRDNTSTRIYMTVTSKRDIDELLLFSKEDRKRLRSETKRRESLFTRGVGAGASECESEYLTRKLQHDDIIDVSFSNQYFVILEDGLQHREPIRCCREHDSTPGALEQYRVDLQTPLPEVLHPRPNDPDAAPFWQLLRQQPPRPERKTRIETLRAILAAADKTT